MSSAGNESATVLVTGAGGMLGRRLTGALLAADGLTGSDGQRRPIGSILATDVMPAADLPTDPRLTYRVGDLSDPGFVAEIIDPAMTSVFHLAGVVSGAAERDFDLGQRVNVGGTVLLLDALRELRTVPRLVFTSSLAVFGGKLPEVVTDDQRLTPQTSYGMQKATGELLIADFTRRGWIDGRALRLPTICVRPGAPNAAASSFLSSIIREPLAGKPSVCPVPETVQAPLLSPGACVRNLIHAHDLPAADWGWDRALTLPSLDATVAELVDAVERFGGPEARALISYEADPFVATIVAGWPRGLRSTRALDLGFTADASVDALVSAHLADTGGPVKSD